MTGGVTSAGGSLDGRIIAVVGVRSDIAKACAARFERDGAVVVRVDDAEATRGTPSDRHIVAGLATASGAREVEQYCRAQFGRLDAMFYAQSAIDSDTAAEAADIAEWERVYGANLWGPMVYGRTLMPLIAESAGGSIVYLTSIDGILANPTFPAFSTSKAALCSLTRVLAHDGASGGVRVNAVATAAIMQTTRSEPGPAIGEGSLDGVVAVTPLRRAPTPDDVAGAIRFLVSDDAAYVTGVVLPVDGGRLAITSGTLRLRRSADDGGAG